MHAAQGLVKETLSKNTITYTFGIVVDNEDVGTVSRDPTTVVEVLQVGDT